MMPNNFFFFKSHLPIFLFQLNPLCVFCVCVCVLINFIFQYLIDFELVFTSYLGLLSIRLLQFQTNTPIFDWCSILQAFILVIASLSKQNSKKKLLNPI